MKRAFTIIIGFIHDFAAGCWAATVLAVYWLSATSVPPELAVSLSGLKKQFFYLGMACVVLVLGTGAGRTFTYVDNVYGQDAELQRRKMLILKHVFLILVFGAGIYWQGTLAFK